MFMFIIVIGNAVPSISITDKMNTRMCTLCMKVLNDSNECEILGEKMKEMLDLVLVILNFGENKNLMTCKTCKENLHKSYKFKVRCLDTEKCLFPYINSSVNEEVDMKIVYVIEKIIKKSFKFEENEVCRFCLSLTKSNITLTSEILKYGHFFRKFMPEIDLKGTGKAIVCERCHVSLEEYAKFVNLYFDNELKLIEKSREYMGQDTENKTNFARLLTHPPECYNTDIKEEDTFTESFPPKRDNVFVKIEPGMDIDQLLSMHVDETTPEKSEKDEDYYMPVYKFDNSDDSIETEEIEIKLDKGSESVIVDGATENIWQASSEQIENMYVPEEERNLDKISVFTQPDEIFNASTINKIFKCEICSYRAKYKSHLRIHMLIHKKPSEIKMFKCEICSYEAKYRHCLKTHMMIHKKPSDIKMFKCELCTYEGKQKSHLSTHMLFHKKPSEIKWYKCEICAYEAKQKSHLKRHMLIHKKISEIKLYKCEMCTYKTKYKSYLKIHILIHKKTSEIKMLKCDNCTYRANKIYNLKSHMLIHKKPSEIKMFKCEICGYQAKHKNNLKRHVVNHKNSSFIKLSKCEICTYEPKRKCYLKKHMIVHEQP